MFFNIEAFKHEIGQLPVWCYQVVLALIIKRHSYGHLPLNIPSFRHHILSNNAGMENGIESSVLTIKLQSKLF